METSIDAPAALPLGTTPSALNRLLWERAESALLELLIARNSSI